IRGTRRTETHSTEGLPDGGPGSHAPAASSARAPSARGDTRSIAVRNTPANSYPSRAKRSVPLTRGVALLALLPNRELRTRRCFQRQRRERFPEVSSSAAALPRRRNAVQSINRDDRRQSFRGPHIFPAYPDGTTGTSPCAGLSFAYRTFLRRQIDHVSSCESCAGPAMPKP